MARGFARLVSIRVAMSLLTALVVLAVAATTFTITYTQGLDTAESLALRFCEVLASAGRARLEDSFARPVDGLAAIERHFLAPNHPLPVDGPPGFEQLEHNAERTMMVAEMLPRDVFSVFMMYADGSVAYVDNAVSPLTNRRALLVSLGRPNGTTPFAQPIVYQTTIYDFATMTPMRIPPVPILTLDPVSLAGYMAQTIDGFWSPPVLVPNGAITYSRLGLPMGKTFVNASGVPVVLTSAIVSLEAVDAYIEALQGTPNTRFAAIDTDLSVIATNHPHGVQEQRSVTTDIRLAAGAPSHCASSFQTAGATAPNWTIACRPLAASYPYAPVRLAAEDGELRAVITAGNNSEVRRGAGGLVTKRHAGDDGVFYVSVAGVGSDLGKFPLSLLVAIPEEDVLSDVYKARDVAIGTVVAIFVVATALSFAVIFAVLRPLQRVADNMRRTARLREVPDEDAAPRSSLHEVQELETAYAGMNAAIRSFTRYVPRDVVKDLLASGQLCAIRMAPARCTILFADIENFTSMCERLPPAELSVLVQAYFQRMSHHVMRHSGVVDKFIGDCVMAVWGAPVAVGNAELRASLCALRLERETRVAPLSAEFGRAGERLGIRVGLSTGDVLAGNMGSEERMSYTVIGDDVNLAARLEALNKQFGTRIMLPEATVAPIPTGILVTRLLSKARVKGKQRATRVYELVGIRAGCLSGDAAAALRDADVGAAVAPPILTRGATSPRHANASSSANRPAPSVNSISFMSESGALSRGAATDDTFAASIDIEAERATAQAREVLRKRAADMVPCATLLREALALDDAPLTAAADAVRRAELHTEAALFIAEGAQDRARDALEELATKFQTTADDPATARLVKECAELEDADPCTSSDSALLGGPPSTGDVTATPGTAFGGSGVLDQTSPRTDMLVASLRD